MKFDMPIYVLCLSIAFCFGIVPTVDAENRDKFLALGTGTTGGVYYPVGQAICEQINSGRLQHGTRCLAYSTGGSEYNLQALASGELDLAITRADLALQAYRGELNGAATKSGATLRSIAALYPMPIGIVVKEDGDIRSFDDLPGHRLNIGNKGSGTPPVVEMLLNARGWSMDDFSDIYGLSTTQMVDAFCRNEVDILVEVIGIPSSYYHQVLNDCGGRILSLPTELVAWIARSNPAFEAVIIPSGTFSHTSKDVLTLQSNAVLVSDDRLSLESISYATAAIFDGLTALRVAHPALRTADTETMSRGAKFLPLHDGARKYYQDNGLVSAQWQGSEKKQ